MDGQETVCNVYLYRLTLSNQPSRK